MLVGGIGVAIWQIVETRRSTEKQLKAARLSTNAHVVIEISRELRSEENLNLLREIYSYQPKHLGVELNQERINKIESILNRLGMLGSFVAEDLIDEAIAVDTIGGVTALRCWYQLNTYVRETRQKRGGHFGEYFEDFVRRSLDYFKKNNKKVLFSREGETKSLDLVAEFQSTSEIYPRGLAEMNNRGG